MSQICISIIRSMSFVCCSHGDFVTIIDLPEGEHQYKFCVDGEWKFDPSVVRSSLFKYCIFLSATLFFKPIVEKGWPQNM